MVGTPVRTMQAVQSTGMDTQIWKDVVFIWDGYFVILLKGILLVMFGVLWAELSLLVSMFVKNRYIAFVIPYLLYQLCWLLDIGGEKYRGLNPVYMIDSNAQASEMSIAQPFAVFVMYIIIVCIACIFVFRGLVKSEKI